VGVWIEGEVILGNGGQAEISKHWVLIIVNENVAL
jgi:hypothetical protein